MLPLKVTQEKDRIQALQSLLEQSVNSVDAQIQNIYSNHLVLASAGFVEKSTLLILSEYTRRNGDLRVKRYIERNISRQNSLNCEKIKLLVELFDLSWWGAIEDRTTPEAMSAVDSLKTLRDQIAHGKPNGTGFVTVKTYHKGATKFVMDLAHVVLR